jgi:hypothetical protein
MSTTQIYVLLIVLVEKGANNYEILALQDQVIG